jgi:hypothetical protein
VSSSFEKIDYSIRPAKHTERRMLSEVFRRLWPFQSIADYVYVGFGAVTFSDFILFHRNIGVREMISIERETESIERVRQNIPFDILVDNRTASEVLPELEWSRRHILWLDYDDPLSPDMLLDARTVAANASSGTVLAVSFNCHRARELDEAKGAGEEIDALELFRDRFGRERIPNEVSDDDLYGWPFGALGRKLIRDEVEEALAVRNIDSTNLMSFHQICEIEYQDGAKMTTLVGILVADSDADKLFACSFNSLDFLASGGDPIRIAVPKLTVREIRNLERQLPLPVGADIEFGHVPEDDARKFAELYRYLPNFAILEA